MLYTRGGKLLLSVSEDLIKACPEDDIEPCPDTLTVTFSGIDNCGEISCGGPADADILNGTWTLHETTECTYESDEETVDIYVKISENFGEIFGSVKNTSTGSAFDNLDQYNVYRRETFQNLRSCEGSVQCEGHNGQCYIY